MADDFLLSLVDCQVSSLLHAPQTQTHSAPRVLLRSLFPVVPVALCLALALVGHGVPDACAVGLAGSSPVWYWISFLAVAYPFATVFGKAPHLRFSAKLAASLLLVAWGVSSFEAGLLVFLGSRDLAWAAGFSLYTIVGLIAVPLYFYVEIDKDHDAFAMEATSEGGGADAAGGGKLGSRLAVFVASFSVVLSLASTWSYTTKSSFISPGVGVGVGPNTGAGANAPSGTWGHFAAADDDWLGKKREHAMWKSLILYLLPAQAVILWVNRKRRIRFSFAYCVFYSVLGTRVPDFLAFWTVHVFTALGSMASVSSSSNASATPSPPLPLPGTGAGTGGTGSDPWLTRLVWQTLGPDVSRFSVSLGYLLCMSLYMRLLTKVTEAMSSPLMFPRYMFHAQVYYYSTYYVLVSSASRDMDALFWAMVVWMNAYYVLSSTGMIHEWGTKAYHVVFGATSGDADADTDAHAELVTWIQLADQDALADATSLLAVPTLITAFAALAAREAIATANSLDAKVVEVRVEHYNGASLDIFNLWLRFGIMFMARLVSSRVSRVVFRRKMARLMGGYSFVPSSASQPPLPSALSRKSSEYTPPELADSGDFPSGGAATSTRGATSAVLTPAEVAAADSEFRQVSPYYCLVAVHAMYSLFHNPDYPTRYAFCSSRFTEVSS